MESDNITVSGVLNSDVCDIPYNREEKTSSFITYLNDCITYSRHQVVIMPNVHEYEVRSFITQQSTWSIRQSAGPILINQSYSAFLPAPRDVVSRRFTQGSSYVKGRIMPEVYSEWMQGPVFYNPQLEHFSLAMPMSRDELRVISGITTAAICSGTAVTANHYLYFKLFCNVFARARLAVAKVDPVLPVITAANTRLVYVQIGQTVPTFTADQLLEYATQQYFAGFESRCNEQSYITMLEIIGYEGMYFLPDPHIVTVPWKEFVFDSIPFVYFTTSARQHVAADITAESLLGETIRLAGRRKEGQDCLRGLMMAIEVMAGDLHRHCRLAQRNNPTEPMKATPIHQGGPRTNISDFVPANASVFDPADDPDSDMFVGDTLTENDAFRMEDYQTIHLDAFGQFCTTPINRSLGTNWFHELLFINGSKEPLPYSLQDIMRYNAHQICQLFVLGFAITNAASTTVNMSFNICGSVLDEMSRGVPISSFTTFWYSFGYGWTATGSYDAPYFNYVYGVMSAMIGKEHGINLQNRSYNNGQQYNMEHNDRYGVYHFASGTLPFQTHLVLAIDNFIVLRPREWGLFTPGIYLTLRENIANVFNHPNKMTCLTHIGHNTYITRSKYDGLRSCTPTFCVLLLNALFSPILRTARTQFTFRYYRHSANMHPSAPGWNTDNADAHPKPIIDPELKILKPGSVKHFDWRAGNHLAPAVDIPTEAIYFLMFQQEKQFIGAGFNLERGAPNMVVPPGYKLADWQIPDDQSLGEI